MVRREDGATEGDRDDNKHELFLVVLDTLKDDKMVIDNGDVDVVTVGGMNVSNGKGLGAFG
jgi:hypothetical protein